MRNALEKSNEEFWKIYNSLAKPQKNNISAANIEKSSPNSINRSK